MSKFYVPLMACGLGLAFFSTVSAQGVDCQRLLNALVNSPPGVYTPQQAQEMGMVYNRECQGSNQAQQQYYEQQYQQQQQQQQNSEAEAFGEALGQFLGGLMRR